MSTTRHIVAVQMLRFVAAVCVVLHHAEFIGYHLGRYRGVELERIELANAGQAGVDLFFAISGFIMVVSSTRLFGQPGARMTFIARRLIRIFPFFWMVNAAVLAWDWRIGIRHEPLAVLANLALYPFSATPGQIGVTPVISVSWTLYYEMLFYAIFAACLAGSARQTVARVSAVLAALVAIGVAADLPMPFAYWSSPAVLEFAGGMAIALLWQSGVRLHALLRLAMVGVAVALVLTHLAGWPTAVVGWTRVLTWGVAGWLVLAASVLGSLPLRATGFWQAGGDISYALYLVHLPIMLAVQFLWRHFKLPYGGLEHGLFSVMMVAASLIAAKIIHDFIELPVTRWLNRRIAPPLSAAPA